MKSLKILHVMRSEAWGGLELYALQLMEQLNMAGLSGELLCRPGSKVANEAKARNIPLAHFRPGDEQHSCDGRILRSDGYTHIQIHHSYDLRWTRQWLMGVKTPLIYSFYMSAKPKHDFYHAWIYSRMSAIVSSSNWVCENIKSNYPLPPERARLIRYGREPNSLTATAAEIQEVRTRHATDSRRLIFGTLCRMDTGKGILDLAAALDHFTEAELAQFEIWLIGDPTLLRLDQDGVPVYESNSQKIYAQLQEIAARPKFRKTLKLIPYQKNALLYLQAMDAFLLASHEETYSLAVIDAMVAGLPILGTHSGGTIEQIGESGSRGIFFEPKNPESCAQAIRQGISNPAGLKALGLAAQEWALQQHQWRRCIAEWKALYIQTALL